jgi:hypothetical protein
MKKHRHLIQDIKSEIDIATAHAEGIEGQVMELEVEFNERLVRLEMRDPQARDTAKQALAVEKATLLEALNLGEAYATVKRAARRFSMLGRVHEIAWTAISVEAMSAILAGYLFRSSDDLKNIPGSTETVDRLAEALYAYFHVAFIDENDARVRLVWSEIETILRNIGRDI